MTLDRLRKILFGIVVAVIVIVAGLSLMDNTTIVNSQKATTRPQRMTKQYLSMEQHMQKQ